MSKGVMAALNRAYMEGQICLFTGAGVSFTAADEYRLEKPGWWGLLFEVYKQLHGKREKKTWSDFIALREKHETAWDVATTLAEQAGDEEKFIKIMRQVLVTSTGSDERYKRLPMDYLDKANTLNAVIAFCSRLRAIRKNPCLDRNPRVRAVLTANYDWFLEGGATQKYNASPFKPMATLKSKERPSKLSVFHIHGYVPHGIKREPECEIILTKKSYEKAYHPGTFTVEKLDQFLPKYSTLFLGFSFDDETFLEHLEALAKKEKLPVHFALFRGDEPTGELLGRIQKINIRPILYADHKEVPELLWRVYRKGLDEKDRKVPIEVMKSGSWQCAGYAELSKWLYWQLLLLNKP